MRRTLSLILLVLVCLLPAGCANQEIRSKQAILKDTLRAYAATIRWGEIEQAVSFIDPKVLAEHPPSTIDLERFKQVRVSSYDESPLVTVGPEEVRQTVQLDLFNVNTQTARSAVDHQIWKYDKATKHWWLVSGLPDISRRE
ncbi:hypothetical protein [Dokdonella sp.]|uniref:hypothetical protein n=1 Tax=Dokdonella sp. TaxID=2291710 RepID=UPI0025B9C90F|nr:hypothetical protein [Dokdonella sp.]MBX3690097.1 hypothetical protein [Dokdonella sp.]